MPKTTPVFLVLLALCPLALGSSTPAPEDVTATFDGLGVTLSWLPAEGATSYHVYGIQDGAPTLLSQTPALSARVPTGFSVYGVASVSINGDESSITVAGKCVTVAPVGTIPPVIIHDC